MQSLLKRGLDIAASCTALLCLSPIIGAVYLAIFIRLGQPVIFRQLRPGYKGQPFYVYKFRTMMRASHLNGRPLSDGERMGRLGKLLRKLSLDELPQLWNVLKGDMSLIGPRPLLMDYLPLYTPEQMRRHDVRPGITGLAQVSGRNNLPWEQKFELDVWSVDNWSLWLDIRIFVLTIQKVMKGDGVSAQGVATMTKFTGSKKDAA
jgi:lipopolysaccharide/colanic/teichoic acid biosynthesis glycosyltransferase